MSSLIKVLVGVVVIVFAGVLMFAGFLAGRVDWWRPKPEKVVEQTTPARADPAVTLCAAFIRTQLPQELSFELVNAAIVGRTVAVQFVPQPPGAAVPIKHQCVFKPSEDQWVFDNNPSHTAACEALNQRLRYLFQTNQMIGVALAEQHGLVDCIRDQQLEDARLLFLASLMELRLRREANSTDTSGVVMSDYPIKRELTALQ